MAVCTKTAACTKMGRKDQRRSVPRFKAGSTPGSSCDICAGTACSAHVREKPEIQTCPCDPRLKIPDTEIDQSSTLLRYTNPYKVVMNIRKTDLKPKPFEVGAKPESQLLTDHSPETQEVLDCIQEPRMWMEDGEHWTQVVSPATTKRHEILLLYDDVNRSLWKRHARPNGMCRVRYGIMRQLFDELTRQVTVTCAERGLFLVRIRAELNYSIQVYHYMWRDIMEYFDPIVEKSVEMMASHRSQVEELEAEIKRIKEEMEDVHWKTVLMEQEKAYERQAMLEWYKCNIEEEKLQMQRLSTLYGAMTTGDFNVIDTADILSLEEDEGKEPVKKRKHSDLDVTHALQLSDMLKELIQERKVAEGRRKTKQLLENELVWVRGEISTNKAFLSDLMRFKEPLDYDKWLDTLVQGRDEPTEITVALGYEKVPAPMHNIDWDPSMNPLKSRSPDTPTPEVYPKMTFIKWLMAREPEKCKYLFKGVWGDEELFARRELQMKMYKQSAVSVSQRCKAGDCRGECCAAIDWDLLIQQARAEFLHGYEDRPLLTFSEFIENWLLKKDVRDIYALSHFFEEREPSHAMISTTTTSSSNLDLAEPTDGKIAFLRPNKFVKRMTEFQPSKNPYKLESSSLRPTFRKEGRMLLEGSKLYADPFAPRLKDPCRDN